MLLLPLPGIREGPTPSGVIVEGEREYLGDCVDVVLADTAGFHSAAGSPEALPGGSGPGGRPGVLVDLVLEPDHLAVAHGVAVLERCIERGAALVLAPEASFDDDGVALVLTSSMSTEKSSKFSGTAANTSWATLSGPVKVPEGALPPPGSIHSI